MPSIYQTAQDGTAVQNEQSVGFCKSSERRKWQESGLTWENVVELLQVYSKQGHQGSLPTLLTRLERYRRSKHLRAKPTTAPPCFVHKLSHRLPPEVLEQLIHDYEAGLSTNQLMEVYGLGKGPVLNLLENAGVEVRHQGLDDDGQAEAARLYATGLSAAAVGGSLGVRRTRYSRTHVAGVNIRPRQGGRQATV